MQPEVNVTPLVDVVLVLLIVFMVLAPVLNAEYLLRLPKKADDTQRALVAATADTPVVVHVAVDGSLDVNGVAIPTAELPIRLERILNARPNRLVYVDADDEAPHGRVLEALEPVAQGRAAPIVVATVPVKPGVAPVGVGGTP